VSTTPLTRPLAPHCSLLAALRRGRGSASRWEYPRPIRARAADAGWRRVAMLGALAWLVLARRRMDDPARWVSIKRKRRSAIGSRTSRRLHRFRNRAVISARPGGRRSPSGRREVVDCGRLGVGRLQGPRRQRRKVREAESGAQAPVRWRSAWGCCDSRLGGGSRWLSKRAQNVKRPRAGRGAASGSWEVLFHRRGGLLRIGACCRWRSGFS